MTWLLILVFGTGAPITTTSVTLGTGRHYFRAAKPLIPVIDTMSVLIGIGDGSNQLLPASVKSDNYGNVKVDVCRSEEECIPMTYSGTYSMRESSGLVFQAAGSSLKDAKFIGVRISTYRLLRGVTIRWSNYTQ